MKAKRILICVLSVLLTGGIIMLGFTGCTGTKYSVDYGSNKNCFKNAKDEYREGAKVKLIYNEKLIGTDTDYSFYIDGEKQNALYERGKGYVLRFTMPSHDIKVTVSAKNSMMNNSYEQETSEFSKKAKLEFHSFDGGGPEYSVEIEDSSVVKYERANKYNKPNHAEMEGSGYTVTFTFTGLKPGATTATVKARSPIGENFDTVYEIIVDKSLKVSVNERETKEDTQD